jgi:hypothetical protein
MASSTSASSRAAVSASDFLHSDAFRSLDSSLLCLEEQKKNIGSTGGSSCGVLTERGPRPRKVPQARWLPLCVRFRGERRHSMTYRAIGSAQSPFKRSARLWPAWLGRAWEDWGGYTVGHSRRISSPSEGAPLRCAVDPVTCVRARISRKTHLPDDRSMIDIKHSRYHENSNERRLSASLSDEMGAGGRSAWLSVEIAPNRAIDAALRALFHAC